MNLNLEIYGETVDKDVIASVLEQVKDDVQNGIDRGYLTQDADNDEDEIQIGFWTLTYDD